ncbi:uncharacterized protein [Apostichopus japonicus]|uniref:uncharacterized protein n=1 Tax=Stichopus japonicus TaxID=307972 RepID=UPI003AB55908
MENIVFFIVVAFIILHVNTGDGHFSQLFGISTSQDNNRDEVSNASRKSEQAPERHKRYASQAELKEEQYEEEDGWFVLNLNSVLCFFAMIFFTTGMLCTLYLACFKDKPKDKGMVGGFMDQFR